MGAPGDRPPGPADASLVRVLDTLIRLEERAARRMPAWPYSSMAMSHQAAATGGSVRKRRKNRE